MNANPALTNVPLIELRHVDKAFTKEERQDLMVLQDVNLKMQENQIIALLGKSGSGKSTLLRIIAGLTTPSSGEVFYRGKLVTGPVKGVAMVFQNFALMPWLTVLQNVELGLEAQGVSRDERRERALQAIDIIGLDGFESAYPRELSGGMRQRVGLARALVVNPDILLLDEPFSALDVLTAENLLTDLMDLWEEKKTQTKGMLFVTHDIEDATWIADRIIIFGSDPGGIRAEINVTVAKPRNEQDPEYRDLVDQIYTLMTTQPQIAGVVGIPFKAKIIHFGYRLPDVEVSELSGLLEKLLDEYQGKCDLPELAEALHLDVDNLFPLTEGLDILGFAITREGDIHITQIGKDFALGDIQQKKQLFAKQLLKHVPLAKRIRRVLDERPEHSASKARFLNELEDYLSEEEAERVLHTVIEWGRYAEIFAYDTNSETLNLENPK